MAIDINKLKARLGTLNNKSSTKDFIWKPSGKHIIRIVPYIHCMDNPFIELKFHYGLNGKTFLSPSTFDRPDPIVELVNKLKKTGDKEDYKQAKILEPKMRVYVPILVRGEEDAGVKFWGFGKQTYAELISIIADPDYGDIADPKSGRDITVEFIPKEETVKKQFPETTIRVKPNSSVVIDPSNKAVMEKLKNQKNILEIYKEPTYDELSENLEKWLSSGSSDEQSEETASAPVNTEVVDDEPPVKSSTKKDEPKSEVKKAASTQDVENAFDEMFKKK